MLCVNAGEILVVTSDEYVATKDDIVEESAGIVCCKEFLFAYRVFELVIVEFSREGADDLFGPVEFLHEHCSHGVFLSCVRIDDESFVGIGVCA